MIIIYFLILTGLFIISYGYIDPNLILTNNPVLQNIFKPLSDLAYHHRPVSTILFLVLLLGLFACYGIFLKHHSQVFQNWKRLFAVLIASAILLAFSYPSLTYDLFNYIMTAKVAYTYHENPYVVMPVEIPNDPNLAFTRASNKVALYGPVWLAITAVPHYLGAGNIWQTIITFKLMNAAAYIGFCYFIYRATAKQANVVFFALNPLVLMEVVMNGHNDIYMMFLALGGLLLWQKDTVKSKLSGILLLVASWFIKGATVVIVPLLFLKKLTRERMLVLVFLLLAVVFFIVAPIREELYPWYAVWLIMPVSLLPLKSHRVLAGFIIVLSFALELRNLPYMWMGYYGGPGPFLRVAVSVVPVALYFGYLGIVYIKKIRS